ncbi:MAG: response regulator transcription factor [Dehalococcoidia bacterium]|nr:response regulator transcription factor [Dehalococcoidia bacterium]
MISIVLADDHHVVRQGLRALLESYQDFTVVGETSSGLEATQLTEKLKPDILLLDLMMGVMNGFEVTRQVRKRSPTTAVVILSMYADEAYVLEALRAGAKAYALKESTSEELVHGIRQAFAGHRYLSSQLSELAIKHYLSKTDQSDLTTYETLTMREREILHLVANGMTSAEIAQRLQVASHTVDLHRSSMMRKLGLKNQIQLVRYAILRGITPTAESGGQASSKESTE